MAKKLRGRHVEFGVEKRTIDFSNLESTVFSGDQLQVDKQLLSAVLQKIPQPISLGGQLLRQAV